jgi:hypothetical protein
MDVRLFKEAREEEEEEVSEEEGRESSLSLVFGDLIKTEDMTYFWIEGGLLFGVSDSFLGRMVMEY